MTPGLQRITADEYHRDPAPVASLSAGIVDILTRESPLHAWHAHPKLNPEYQPEVDSKFDIGTAAHALLFEGMDNCVIVEADDWRTKLAREARDAIRASGKIPLLAKQHYAVEAMVSAARAAWERNKALKGYRIEDAMNEWSILWQEGETWCRCKPDSLSSDRRLIVDAKFTETSVNPLSFKRQISKMGYDARGAFYLMGNAATGGPEDAMYVFLAQEQTPPYAASFVGLSPTYVALGRSKVERAISIWKTCMQTGRWQGYVDDIYWADPETYEVSQWEELEISGIEYDPAVLFGEKK